MIEHPRPVDPKLLHRQSEHDRADGRGESPLGFKHPSNLLNALLAAMSGFAVYMQDVQPPNRQSNAPVISMGAGESSPIKQQSEQSLDGTLAELQKTSQTLETEASIPMLKSTDIREACRITSDWFLKESHNLQIVWEYLKSRKSNWSIEIEKVLDDAIALGKPLARFSSKVPTTRQDLENIVNEKFGELKPAKCGWMLSFASAYLDDAQGLGKRFAVHTTTFIVADIKSGDEKRVAEARRAGEALIAALKSAR